MSVLRAILRLRCPRCLRGRVFGSLLTWRMHSQCSECQLPFQREPGYYIGAFYISYGIGVFLITPVALPMALQQISASWIVAVIGVEIVVLAPFAFRYSRVLWLHFDQWMDPQ